MKKVFRLDLFTFIAVISIYAISTFFFILESRKYENKISDYEKRHNYAINVFNEAYSKYYNEYYSTNTLFTKYFDYIRRQEIKEKTGIEIPEYLSKEQLDSIIYYGLEYDIPYKINFRLIYTESRFKVDSESSEGAKGLYQIMPYNTYRLNKIDIYSNIEQGCYILHALYEEYGTWERALSAYNSGSPDSKSKHVKSFVNFILNKDETNKAKL